MSYHTRSARGFRRIGFGMTEADAAAAARGDVAAPMTLAPAARAALIAEAARLRTRRNWELGSVLVSGAAGVTSLALFASGRYMAGYALAATSALIGGVITILRISSEYDQQILDLERAETP
jgi:hypothetical protein